ncbi:unnamed protein product [Sphenostylis stenocarpa]|uniref:Uncharacterized protein n=1 Tax=Sphenostylis stenocarpa TaxID=92480 RepID=A0AA86SB52_9FABA|nr:unnamed protein product [Sphenostylis stenocarpa]
MNMVAIYGTQNNLCSSAMAYVVKKSMKQPLQLKCCVKVHLQTWIIKFKWVERISDQSEQEKELGDSLVETLRSSELAESGLVRFSEPILWIRGVGENLNPRENGEETMHLVRVLLEEDPRIKIESALGVMHDDDTISIVRDGGVDRGYLTSLRGVQ